MTRTANIEVYRDNEELFAVLSDHRPDLPKPIDQKLQEWAKEHFVELKEGESIKEAGELVYEPNDKIVEMRRK
jgi:hypothetical protein